jgi:hypothetical protein
VAALRVRPVVIYFLKILLSMRSNLERVPSFDQIADGLPIPAQEAVI